MLAQIASKLFDLEGVVQLEVADDTAPAALRRRFSKVPTLDLGVTVNDRGLTDADREFVLAYENQSAEIEATLERIVRLHSRVIAQIKTDLFECAPIALDPSPERPTITLSVIQKLGA